MRPLTICARKPSLFSVLWFLLTPRPQTKSHGHPSFPQGSAAALELNVPSVSWLHQAYGCVYIFLPSLAMRTQLFSGHPLPSPANFKGEDGPLVQQMSIALLWSVGFRTEVQAQVHGSRNVTLSWTSTLKLPFIC